MISVFWLFLAFVFGRLAFALARESGPVRRVDYLQLALLLACMVASLVWASQALAGAAVFRGADPVVTSPDYRVACRSPIWRRVYPVLAGEVCPPILRGNRDNRQHDRRGGSGKDRSACEISWQVDDLGRITYRDCRGRPLKAPPVRRLVKD